MTQGPNLGPGGLSLVSCFPSHFPEPNLTPTPEKKVPVGLGLPGLEVQDPSSGGREAVHRCKREHLTPANEAQWSPGNKEGLGN